MGNLNSGRRPQPTALTLLRGNPSKKKPNADEPKPPSGDVTKPDELSEAAGMIWDRLAPVCLKMGTLTTADVTAFKTLCELQATFTAVAMQKGKQGFDVRLERDTATALRPYYAMFGLEPAGRARLSVPQPRETVTKWAGELG